MTFLAHLSTYLGIWADRPVRQSKSNHSELTPGIDDSVIIELDHDKFLQLIKVGFVFLVLLVTFIIDVGEEDTFCSVFLLVERVMPVLGLD